MPGLLDILGGNFGTDDPRQAAYLALASGLMSGRGNFNQVAGNALMDAQKSYQGANQLKQRSEMNQLEMDDIRRKAKQAEEQQKRLDEQRALDEQFRALIPNPQQQAIQGALAGGGGPTVANAGKIEPVDPTKQMMFEALRNKQITALDYLKTQQKDNTPVIIPEGGILGTHAGKVLLENKKDFKPEAAKQSPEAQLIADRDKQVPGSPTWHLLNNILKKKGDWKPDSGGGIAPEITDPTTKERIDFYAKQEIAGMKDWRTNFRGKDAQIMLAQVMRRVPEMAKELGIAPEDLGTNRANYTALSATQRDITKRQEAVDLFSSKVERDMKTLDNLLDSATTGSPLLVSKPINYLRRQFSDPGLSQLDLAAKQVGTEYERLITGGSLSIAQLHTGAQDDAARLINGDMTPKQARAIMDTMRIEINNARAAAKESTDRIGKKIKELGGAPKPETQVQTATNPKTGEKLMLKDGAWVPFK
jgi:hypothetical protein